MITILIEEWHLDLYVFEKSAQCISEKNNIDPISLRKVVGL